MDWEREKRENEKGVTEIREENTHTKLRSRLTVLAGYRAVKYGGHYNKVHIIMRCMSTV